jgi:hypothetical protein
MICQSLVTKRRHEGQKKRPLGHSTRFQEDMAIYGSRIQALYSGDYNGERQRRIDG